MTGVVKVVLACNAENKFKNSRMIIERIANAIAIWAIGTRTQRTEIILSVLVRCPEAVFISSRIGFNVAQEELALGC